MEKIFNAINQDPDKKREDFARINNQRNLYQIIGNINSYSSAIPECSRIENFSKVPRCYSNRGN